LFIFVCWVLVVFVFICSALVAFVAPVTHPASSCSQVWWQVLGVSLVVVLCTCVLGHSFVMGYDVAVSTCNPPCKQWLTGLGTGAGLLFIA
jgi:hypothetical protein